MLKILVVGNGAREHALLWKLNRDRPDATLFVTRGSGGTGDLATPLPLAPTEFQALAGWALRERIDLTVVGPEVPLAEGIVDHFSSQDLLIFGPTKAAAEIESSKAFAKHLMQRYGIPTATFEVFTDSAAAIAHIRSKGGPIVVKASGLAAGKGAVVCETTDEGVAAVETMRSSAAGEQLVVEEYMEGEEISVFAICDGASFVTLLPAQDHKRIGEGDTGPNTGGMGAYAPVSIATPELIARIDAEILQPTMDALAEEGRPFRGVLYAGLMITAEGPKVVEFNCRFGDPEAQVLLPLLDSSLFDLLMASATGSLSGAAPVAWRPGAAVTTVIAAGGYPGDYTKGVPITVPPELSHLDDVLVFHAGTAVRDATLVTNGGRIFSVTGLGATVAEAGARSRDAAVQILFEGRTFRRDIGWREAARHTDGFVDRLNRIEQHERASDKPAAK